MRSLPLSADPAPVRWPWTRTAGWCRKSSAAGPAAMTIDRPNRVRGGPVFSAVEPPGLLALLQPGRARRDEPASGPPDIGGRLSAARRAVRRTRGCLVSYPGRDQRPSPRRRRSGRARRVRFRELARGPAEQWSLRDRHQEPPGALTGAAAWRARREARGERLRRAGARHFGRDVTARRCRQGRGASSGTHTEAVSSTAQGAAQPGAVGGVALTRCQNACTGPAMRCSGSGEEGDPGRTANPQTAHC